MSGCAPEPPTTTGGTGMTQLLQVGVANDGVIAADTGVLEPDGFDPFCWGPVTGGDDGYVRFGGLGIAMSFANAGIPVTLIETGEEQLKRGLGIIQKNYEATAARGGIPADAPAKRMGLITGVVGLENLRLDVPLVR